MSKYWSQTTKNLKSYTPGEQPKDQRYIKLNTNESPYPPSPNVFEAIQRAVNPELRLYPDPDTTVLRETIARYYGRRPEEVFVGNGSDELLALTFRAFFDPDRTILFPDITYSFYPVYANLFSLQYREIPVNSDFTVPAKAFSPPNGGVILPNPNAPTAIALPANEIRKILDQNRENVVVIDEAYIDFGGESVISLIKDYDNLLVIQTLSKSRALAGLRIGIALGHTDLISALSRVKNSFNSYTLDRLALAGAVAAFEDESYFRWTQGEIIATRKWILNQVRAMGFAATDSMANFIFISHPRRNAAELYQALRDRGILVRYFNMPRIDNHLRISIGTFEEMQTLVNAFDEILSQK